MNLSNELHIFLLKENSFEWEKILTTYNLSDEFIQILSTMTSLSQLRRIREALQCGISLNKIKVFAKPIYTGKQMEQIKLGFLNGLTNEQINLYANPQFNYMQMKQIRIGFEEGLSYEQVKSYADATLHFRELIEKRKKLQYQNISKSINRIFKSINN